MFRVKKLISYLVASVLMDPVATMTNAKNVWYGVKAIMNVVENNSIIYDGLTAEKELYTNENSEVISLL